VVQAALGVEALARVSVRHQAGGAAAAGERRDTGGEKLPEAAVEERRAVGRRARRVRDSSYGAEGILVDIVPRPYRGFQGYQLVWPTPPVVSLDQARVAVLLKHSPTVVDEEVVIQKCSARGV